jgi:hypothetical protein
VASISSVVADELVALRQVEHRECSAKYKVLFGYETGYRVSRAGRARQWKKANKTSDDSGKGITE